MRRGWVCRRYLSMPWVVSFTCISFVPDGAALAGWILTALSCMFTFSTMPYACLWPSHLFTMFKITHNTYKGKFFILTISSALSTSPMANGVSTPILPYLFSPVELCWCFGCSHGNTLHFQSVSPPTEWFLREELILSPIPYNMPNIYTT